MLERYQNVSHCLHGESGEGDLCRFVERIGQYGELSVADTRENRVLMNHPVHIVDSETGTTSPSAFIPFCDFAGKMGDVGTKLPEFDLPVCNSFTKTVIDGQLCYELEVNKFYTEPRVEEQLTKGLTLILDYNEDRNLIRVNEGEERREINIVDNIVNFEESKEALIYIKSISMNTSHITSYLHLRRSYQSSSPVGVVESSDSQSWFDLGRP